MDTLICKMKARRYHRERKGTLFKSVLENEEAALIEDYHEELHYDKQHQKRIISNINRKIIK